MVIMSPEVMQNQKRKARKVKFDVCGVILTIASILFGIGLSMYLSIKVGSSYASYAIAIVGVLASLVIVTVAGIYIEKLVIAYLKIENDWELINPILATQGFTYQEASGFYQKNDKMFDVRIEEEDDDKIVLVIKEVQLVTIV